MLVALAVAAAFLALNGCDEKTSGSGQMSGMDHGAMKSAPDAASQPYDLQFLDTMVPHHESAVAMAKMISSRTKNADLNSFATAIVADQNKEISQMKKWRADWYAGKPSAVNMEMPGMARFDEDGNVEALRSEG